MGNWDFITDDGVSVNRVVALSMSVLHHGMACLAKDVVPANKGTVVATARVFESYLEDTQEERPASW